MLPFLQRTALRPSARFSASRSAQKEHVNHEPPCGFQVSCASSTLRKPAALPSRLKRTAKGSPLQKDSLQPEPSRPVPGFFLFIEASIRGVCSLLWGRGRCGLYRKAPAAASSLRRLAYAHNMISSAERSFRSRPVDARCLNPCGLSYTCIRAAPTHWYLPFLPRRVLS